MGKDGDQVHPESQFERVNTSIQRHINTPAQRRTKAPAFLLHDVSERLKALSNKIRNALLRSSATSSSERSRHIYLNIERRNFSVDHRHGTPFIDNKIRSSRHQLWNFIPLQLFAQFSKLGNLYFLCVSVLQLIPNVSTSGRYTTLAPLLVFVGLSILKEGRDDLRRSKLDKEENTRIASVFSIPPSFSTNERVELDATSFWTQTRWGKIQVGNVVRIRCDQVIPADMVLLTVDASDGTAYAETMALDGETNLKKRQVCPLISSNCRQISHLRNMVVYFEVEPPNAELYRFEGKVGIAEDVMTLTDSEIMYRGSVLRNTKEILGMVIYTGEECKIRLNAAKNPRIKAPALQSLVNKIILMIVGFVVLLSILFTAAYQIWQKQTGKYAFYLFDIHIGFSQLMASFFLMFNSIIPLSLYVSLEIVKDVQTGLMSDDLEIYDDASDTPMMARTSTIHEDLGQVSVIFSDKTGTLTANSMVLRKLCIFGNAWVHDNDILNTERFAVEKAESLRKHTLESKKMVLEPQIKLDGSKRIEKETLQSRLSDGTTSAMLEHLRREPHSEFAKRVRFFLLSIAICHMCFPVKDIDGVIKFQAASPDEVALVKGAQDLGYLVFDRQTYNMTIKISSLGPGVDSIYETYEILDIIEYSSSRKRMSVVVRLPDQRICVFCKGADTAIGHRLRLSEVAREVSTSVEQKFNARNNVEAQKAYEPANIKGGFQKQTKDGSHEIESDQDSSAIPWNGDSEHGEEVVFKDGKTDPDALQASIHFPASGASLPSSEERSFIVKERMDEVLKQHLLVDDSMVLKRCFQHANDFASEGLRILLYAYKFINEGDYAVWQKLYRSATTSLVNRQLLIEEASEQLEQDLEVAGVTAVEDKLQEGVPQTIEKLRQANIKIWMLTGDKRETAISIGRSCHLILACSTVYILDGPLDEIGRTIATAIANITTGSIAHCVVVIDGESHYSIEARPTVQDLFIKLITVADSVICCRFSPRQKASIVKIVRKHLPRKVTLAIGDGANDIAMIQEAHIGIGITGHEGMQAARASDYSIAKFRFLQKLILVHGHWNYIRTCKFIMGMLWKEMFFYLTQVIYQHWNGFTGVSLYEDWSLTLFQILFTPLPVVFMGIFEKDLAASTLLTAPKLYSQGQRNGMLSFKVYLWWTFLSACDATIVFFIGLGLYGNTLSRDNSLFALGNLTYTACVIIICFKMQILEMHNITITAGIAIFFSVGSWFAWNLIIGAVFTDDPVYHTKEGLLHRFGQDPLWWLTLVVILFAVGSFELAVSTLRVTIWPTEVDIFQRHEKEPKTPNGLTAT